VNVKRRRVSSICLFPLLSARVRFYSDEIFRVRIEIQAGRISFILKGSITEVSSCES
jgi:hypothetical protein